MSRALKIAGGLLLAAGFLLAAFVAASLAFPRWFAPRIPATELRSPSGRVYKIMARGPVASSGGPRKTFGIQYLADDLSDPGRLSRSADELASLLRPQLEAEDYDGLVVTAYAVDRQIGFLTVAKTVVVLYERAAGISTAWGFLGMTPAPGTPETAAARRELERAYVELDHAVCAKDPRAIWDMETSDYRDTTIEGHAMDKREDMSFMQKQFAELAAVSTFTATIAELSVQGDRAAVTVKSAFTGRVSRQARKDEVYFNEGWSQDVWKKTPKGWRIAASVDVATKSFFFKPQP